MYDEEIDKEAFLMKTSFYEVFFTMLRLPSC